MSKGSIREGFVTKAELRKQIKGLLDHNRFLEKRQERLLKLIAKMAIKLENVRMHMAVSLCGEDIMEGEYDDGR